MKKVENRTGVPDSVQMTPGMLELCRELKYLRSLRLVTRGITHNYNNIFSGLLGTLQMTEGAKQKSGLDTQTTLINRAINETEVLFGFARHSEKKKSVQSFSTIAEDAIRALRAVSPKYSVNLQCHNSFLRVKGGYSDLVLMLFFLGENGIEAMPEGGEVLFEVSIDSDISRKPWIKVVISDDGPGVEPVVARNLFLPFTTTKDQEKHHGLGLFFARKIAEENDGRLDLSTLRSGGDCFTLRLPAICPDEFENMLEGKVTNSRSRAGDIARHVFFVIDDDPNLLDYLVDGLQRKGHIVFSASNCAEALEEFHNVLDIVTLLLVDIGLTDTDGMTCMDRLGKQCKLPGLIFMSGEKDTGCSEKFPGALFLPKPFTIRQLEELAANVSAAR